MTFTQILVAALITPASAFLITAWVLHENRKIGERARARANTRH